MKFNQNVFPFFLVMMMAFSMTLVSCDNEDSDFLEVQERTEQSEFRDGDRGDKTRGRGLKGNKSRILRLLKGDCLALTYPVTVDFPDGTSATANDLEELITALRTYHANADTTQGTPTFVFPLTVTVADSTFDVTSQEELIAAAKLCIKERPNDRNRICFSIIYPLTIENPDGTTVQVASRQEYKQAIREWKTSNPTSDERPTIVYPIEIEFEDGSTQTINSAEELQAAKDDCDED